MKEMVGGCCVCSDERGWPDNPLVYCDGNGCTVAVHQACYGIVSVPTGPWFCRKCECPEIKGKVRCELCPSKSGALKRSDTGGWAHVVCALYIPEVRFGNVTSMEPIVLRLIPPERYNKTCYICQESGKGHRASNGACMQCNKSGCKQQFHVTCAQSLGLLCEEAGNYLDNVKYCGYCQHHYSKLKKGGNVKTIPPYKPVSHDSQSSDSSGEKDNDTASKAESTSSSHSGKSKGPGRKSSHSGKNTPNSSKSSSSNQGSEKSKKSPARRGSTAVDATTSSSGSKGSSTPSPQHSTADNTNTSKGGSTPSHKVTPPRASPVSKSQDFPGVISSIVSAAASISAANSITSSAVTTSVVQSTGSTKSPPVQGSVITNTDCIETKQTKKRKALAAAAALAEFATPVPVSNASPAPSTSAWNDNSVSTDVSMESVDKCSKKQKTEPSEQPALNNQTYIAPPPPPPPITHSPTKLSQRHMPSPMPGPSGMHPPTIRSPSQQQASLDQSVTHAHQVSAPGRTTWGGLNVSYEIQQTEKPGLNTPLGPPKDIPLGPGGVPLTGGGTMMRKKRAAMASMANAPPVPMPAPTSVPMHAPAPPQNLSNARRPHPTPPPIYQETIKDSPPSSPGSDRPLKPKAETKISTTPHYSAPHMLGNELNPDSGIAARLQEQLNAELAAHAPGLQTGNQLVPPPLINKASQNITGPRGSSGAQSLDQLLERQWEQGSQFLMEQAQHFDIASLLSCLHQLRTENVRLEEHVGNLLQRRDHLLAVNARLAIPLTVSQAPPPEPPRCQRENGNQMRPPAPMPVPVPVRNDNMQGERSHQMMVRDVPQKPS